MKKSVLVMLLAFGFMSYLNGQVVSSKSNVVKMTIEPAYEFTLPPNLFVDMKFSDDNGNGIIEADENAVLQIAIMNKGAGPAQGLKVTLASQITDYAFSIGDDIFIKEIKPGDSLNLSIPLKASANVKSNQHQIQIDITEFFGYNMDPATLTVNTLEYQRPEIVFIGMDIYDQGEGTMAIKADGQLQAGEMVKVKLIVQNIGKNTALNSKYNISSRDSNIRIVGGSGDLGDMIVGQVKEIWVTVSPNKLIKYDSNLPIYIDVTEKVGKGSLLAYQLPLALNKIPPKTEIVVVEPDYGKMNQQVARIEYKSDKYTSNIGSKDINAIPATTTKRQDAVAIVIGIEEYQNIPSAPYAARDAEIMTRYFKEVLGIENVITEINEDVSGFFFINIFDTKTGKLNKMINKGQTDVFVYYSGHGIPEKDGNDVYLFPSDGNLEMLDVQGYSLNKLYANLDAMGAKSVTVILDACFTGSSRASTTFMAENVSNTKGTIIKPRINQPWQTNPNFRVFASSRDDQTSLGFDESGTGLFTYYLAIGLQGDADLDKDGKITANELKTFVTDNVSETSVKIRGQQTPQFFGNDEFTIVEF
jgi:hypothetical protein